ncbi:MAG TPA: hypothetical protein VIX37_06855 [Candidatus Sulfotelmatobacter sp.]
MTLAELHPADSRGRCPHILVTDMTDQQLMQRFEADDVPEGSFHHADHVRLAFAYLSEYPPLQALDKFATALQHYTTARGKAQLYNETITHAYFFLIRERMARFPCREWDEFAAQNFDLLRWKDGVLGRYYREETLRSELARTVFVFPDKVL